jgi:hypothetical protein
VSIRKRLDRLIDWYEWARPGRSHQIATPLAFCTCKRFCEERADGTLSYRGHTIVPQVKTPHCGQRIAALKGPSAS